MGLTAASIAFLVLLLVHQFTLQTHRENFPQLKTEKTVIDGVPIAERVRGAMPITMGMQFENFPRFIVGQNIFIADVLVWFEFSQDKVPLDLIDKFSIEDCSIEKKSYPMITQRDGFTLVSYHLRIDFKVPLDYYKFPFDDHRITLVFYNRALDPTQFTLVTSDDKISFSSNFFLPDWRVVQKNEKPVIQTEHGFIYSDLGDALRPKKIFFPAAAFSFIASKTGHFSAMLIFIPLLLLFFLIMVGLLLDVSSFFRLSGTVALITTIVLSYRFNIAGIAPRIDYLTLADKSYLIVIILASIILAYQVMMHRWLTVKVARSEREKQKEVRHQILRYDTLLYCVMQITLVALLAFVFYQ